MSCIFPLEKEYVGFINDRVEFGATMEAFYIGTYTGFRTLKVSYSTVAAWHEMLAMDRQVDV